MRSASGARQKEDVPVCSLQKAPPLLLFASNLPFGSLSSWCPSLAQKRRQRNIGFILKIKNRPVFSHRFTHFGQGVFPAILYEPYRPSQSTDVPVSGTSVPLPAPSPDRVLRHNDLESLLHNLMYPSHGPQVCFIAEVRSRLKNQLPEPLAVQLPQPPRASTSAPPVQARFSLLLIAFNPSKQRRAVGVVCRCNVTHSKAGGEDGLYRPYPHFVRRVSSVNHGGTICRHMLSESMPMLHIYCDGP